MLVQGHKKGESNPRTPVIAQDSVSSVQTVKILYGLAEGEIAGLANGAESIRLEKTPIRTNGVDNFKNVSFDVRNGTNDQSHIAGFDSVVNEIGVSVELRHDRPFTRAFTNLQLSAVAVRLKWDRLAQTNIDNGDVSGYRIDYAIDVMTDGGAWIEVLSAKVEDKASAGYVRTHRIDLPTAKKGWQIRVRRITANSTSEYISDKMYVDAVQEIIDSKLRYPNTALLALQYDAKSFQNIAKLAVRLKGKIIRVPSNYNAQNRTYSGLWDGTFIEAYSNNPAWVFYDLCLSKRYGIGSRLDASMVDKWSLYEMGRYCDELVDDGKGGKEPRFTVNLYLQKTEDAYHVLSQLAGVFRALSYWNGQSIIVNADVPKDPVFTYSRANVVDGLFKYTGSRARDRHTVVKVAWDDPNNDFETDYEWVKDEEAIARLGIRQLDISAFGCTSQAQAYRVGQWALLSEQLETQQVSFKTGLDGFIPQVGDIINISDEIFAGRANGGRVSAINTAKDAVTLDRDVVAKVGDTLLINGADATETRAIVAVNGRVITVDKPFDSVEPQHVWAINSPDLQLMQFRVMSITKDDETFTITGVQYEPKKFTGIESSVKVTPRKITVNDAYRIDAPSFVNLSQSIATHQGQAVTTLTISWGQVAMASHYQVEWRKDGGSWIVMPKQSGVSADITGVYAGQYEARVTAISPFDVASLATYSALTTITGKQGKPPALANIKAVGKLFGMDVSWVFANGSSDANYTEIQVASNANGSDAVLLGMYSYPTNNTTINGLQGNLTQYYRGRIVDKLGNVSDWSNWVSGTTDASADKVLTLLSGQITQTQLAQDLATPIAKIPAIETSVAKIPTLEIGVGKIPSIETSVNAISQNLSVTNANLASETAKLNAAVADIEKSKQAIANAVVDVDALKKDGADFKQEISGIKSQQNALSSEIQTINNSYASADLALSQRIDTIKSASDKAAAD
ncbi:MAG: phage tail protein, partial [Moraxella sp.]